MRRWFKPLRRAGVRRDILAFDVEGSGSPGRFVCGSIEGAYTSRFFTDREEMWRALLYYGARGVWLWSHNLEYDLPVVAGDHLFEGSLIFTHGSMLWATYGEGRHKVRFYDSANLFPRISVEAVGAMVDLPKVSLSSDLLKRLALGLPFSSFSVDEQRMIERYNRRDAEVIYRAVESLQELALDLGGQLKPTLAGVSMDLYRRKFHRWPWMALGEKANELARPAFYGGRTESFRVGQVPGMTLYDITSLYPWVLSKAPFPHPNHLHLMVPHNPAGSWWSWEGVVSARVRVPDVFIPPLPVRYQGRLFFPVGSTDGLWTIAELRQAILDGVELERVDWVFGSDVTFNPFSDFVETLFERRMGYLVSDPTRANLIKLILNSLYGRFGLNPAHGLEQMVPLIDPIDWDDLDGYTVIELGGDLVARGPLASRGYPTYINTLFASQITAYGRVRLLDELKNQGEHAAYCDTDSVMTDGKVQVGHGLGAWRVERENFRADLIGPKEYAIYQAGEEPHYKVKGVPAYVREEYMRSGAVRFFRALSIREALAQGKQPAAWVETIRTRLSTFPKRSVVEFSSTPGQTWRSTRPYSMDDLARFGLARPLELVGVPDPEAYQVPPVGLLKQRSTRE